MADDEYQLTHVGPSEQKGGSWRRVDGFGPPTVYVYLVKGPGGRNRVKGVAAFDDKITAAALGSLPLGRIERLANPPPQEIVYPYEQVKRETQPLARREDESTEEFLKRVAYYYKLFAALSPSPAMDIAEVSNVPVRRVHYWISEARKAGALPKGRRGKVG